MILSITFLLLILFIICKFLVSYIQQIRTGDMNENDLTYWMFSYDFKSKNKEWSPEDRDFLQRKRKRNTLIFILYLIVFFIVLTFSSFVAHILDLIVDFKRFTYPI